MSGLRGAFRGLSYRDVIYPCVSVVNAFCRSIVVVIILTDTTHADFFYRNHHDASNFGISCSGSDSGRVFSADNDSGDPSYWNGYDVFGANSNTGIDTSATNRIDIYAYI
jgi:hypothetical protein